MMWQRLPNTLKKILDQLVQMFLRKISKCRCRISVILAGLSEIRISIIILIPFS